MTAYSLIFKENTEELNQTGCVQEDVVYNALSLVFSYHKPFFCRRPQVKAPFVEYLRNIISTIIALLFLLLLFLLITQSNVVASTDLSRQDSSMIKSNLSVNGGKLVITQVAKLVPSDYHSWMGFGYSFDVDGNYLVAGALDDSVYVFKRSEGSKEWNETKKITPVPEMLGGFGWTVAISDTTLVVGAFDRIAFDEYTGEAYVYEKDYGGLDHWGFIKKMSPPMLPISSTFGQTIDIFGDTIVIGALYDSTRCHNCGSAYIFEKNLGGENNWGLVKELYDPDASPGDVFGSNVSIDQDTILVSSPGDDYIEPGDNLGSVFVYYRNSGGLDNWGNVKIIQPIDTRVFCTNSMKLVGDTAIIGTITNYVSLYSRDFGGDDNWGLMAWLKEDNVDNYGVGVDYFSSYALIGDSGCSRLPPLYAGTAYFYSSDLGDQSPWTLTKKIQASDGSAGDYFGKAVDLTDDEIFIASFRAKTNGVNAGAIYIYQYKIMPPTYFPIIFR